MSKFEVMTPLLSWVDADRRPVASVIEAHLNFLKTAGVNSALVLGTTGEFSSLSVQEREVYLDVVTSVNPGLELMVNIGASALSDCLTLQAHAVRQPGVTSLLWMPPFYFPETQINGLTSFAQALLTHQPKDILFYGYHFPKMSQVSISPELLEACPQMVGWKDTSGDMTRIGEMIQRFPERRVYVGTDFEIAATRQAGGVGVISGLSNIVPELTVQAAAGALQAEQTLKALKDVLNRYPKMPALKSYFQNQYPLMPKPSNIPPFANLLPDEVEAFTREINTLLRSVPQGVTHG